MAAISLEEAYAGQAMLGLLSAGDGENGFDLERRHGETSPEALARRAFQIAEAMILERDRRARNRADAEGPVGLGRQGRRQPVR